MALIAAGAALGIAVPALAEALRPLLLWMSLGTMALALLRVEPAALAGVLRRPGLALLVLGWVTFGVPVLVYASWRAFIRRDWRYAVALVGYCAGWLPWFASIDRQMYFFYAVPMAPFLVMMIALILGEILYPRSRDPERRTLGLLVVCFYLALVITNFAWLFPVLTGIPVSQATWNLQMWLPSWR